MTSKTFNDTIYGKFTTTLKHKEDHETNFISLYASTQLTFPLSRRDEVAFKTLLGDFYLSKDRLHLVRCLFSWKADTDDFDPLGKFEDLVLYINEDEMKFVLSQV